MEIITSRYLVQVTYYSQCALFDYFKQYKIKIHNFKLIDTYTFSFELSSKDYKNLKENIKNVILIKKRGIFPSLYKQMFKRVTIFASILALILFSFLSTLLMKININGTNEMINQEIATYLNTKSIKVYRIKPSIENLKKVKDEYFLNNLNTFESIEFIIKGNALYVSYTLKKKELIIEEKHGKMIAKKDGVIDKILISSGNVLVKEFQYVKKGELLVDDYLYYKDSAIYVGTRGLIYAYTYETVLVSIYYEGNKDEQFVYLLDEARRQVSLDFKDEEHIEKEVINDFYSYQNNIYLSISYTLYENIVIF